MVFAKQHYLDDPILPNLYLLVCLGWQVEMG